MTFSATCWFISPLKAQTKRHNFRDTPSAICSCLHESETNEHYFTRCVTFADERKFLMLMDSITPALTAKYFSIYIT